MPCIHETFSRQVRERGKQCPWHNKTMWALRTPCLPSSYSEARAEICLGCCSESIFIKESIEPLSIHNRRKSAREHCNFLIAAVRVMYALAAPALPFGFIRPMLTEIFKAVAKHEQRPA